MIEFFNETICVLLVIAITIIFLKTIHSNNIENTNQTIEGFQTAPTYYGKFDKNEIAMRLGKEPEFISQINESYKKAYNESELGDRVLTNIALLDKAKAARQQLLGIPDKYSKILNNYKELNDTYNLQKKRLKVF